MSDYMKEAERLLEQYDDACLSIIDMSEEQARTALLAHIQRGAVPEGWQLVPIDPSPGMLDAAEAVDWGDEDTRGSCCNQWHAMLAAAPAPDHFRGAAKMMAVQPACMTCGDHGMIGGLLPNGGGYESAPRPDCTAPAPAEVPMPEPEFDGCGIAYTVDQMRTYGVACRAAGEAAGYARGVAEAGRDAERYRWLCKVLGETQLPTLIERITASYVADYKPSIDAAIDAALRGEVK